MDVARLRKRLDDVRAGRVAVDHAMTELRDLPFAGLEYAAVDHHRALRQGAPEVILGEGKTRETRYVALARVATIEVRPVTPLPYGTVALVWAGTADLPVAVRPWIRFRRGAVMGRGAGTARPSSSVSSGPQEVGR